MSITTKKGDEGISKFWGKGISKDSKIMEAMGDVDELQASLGCARSLLVDGNKKVEMEKIQKNLIGIGGAIVCQNEWDGAIECLDFLDKRIDELQTDMPIMKGFVAYGENQIEANLQLSRAVCRRAERSIVALSKEQYIDKNVLKYINRLSDFLYLEALEQIKK